MTQFCSFYDWEYCIVSTYHIFIPSTVDGHLGCFHVLIIVNSAAVNTGVCMSFWIMVILGNVATNKIAGSYGSFRGFLGGSVVKNTPVMQETSVWYLGQEDPLQKGMATHSSILAWRIPWTEEPGGLQSMGSGRTESDTTEWLHFHFSLSCIGEGNGNPLQCSCLENPRDGEA